MPDPGGAARSAPGVAFFSSRLALQSAQIAPILIGSFPAAGLAAGAAGLAGAVLAWGMNGVTLEEDTRLPSLDEVQLSAVSEDNLLPL